MNIEQVMDEFRAEWNRRRRAGYKRDIELPPMDGHQAQAARDNLFEHRWNPGAFVMYGEHKELAHETRQAIMAAQVAHQSKKKAVKPRAELRRALIERDGDDCWLCRHPLHDDATIEHKLAKANGGTNAFDNLCLAHAECNRALGRLPVEAKEAARAAMQREKSDD